MKEDFMFTSESVTEGHPDKLCDQISDAIVDALLAQDPFTKVRAEVAVSTGILFIAARFSTRASVDIPEVARQVIQQAGYDRPDFNARSSVMMSLAELPLPEPAPVHERYLSDEEIELIPAREQVTVFGFACTQTAALLPLPVWLAHRLMARLSDVRRTRQLPYLAPDGKVQVGVSFHHHRPQRIHSIALLTSQNEAGRPKATVLHDEIMELVVRPVLQEAEMPADEYTRIFINPDGPMIRGGPVLHSGLTGRKNAVDTYGGYAPNSGAALSGKDPGHIDRVGVYAARYAAKNVVAAGLADECEVQISYTIGLSKPVSIRVKTHGTGKIPDSEIAARLQAHFDFRPAAIVRQFNLRTQTADRGGIFYRRLAVFGQMGRIDLEAPWEATDKAEALENG
ncbi:S-adenosylmethionine synthase [Gammaproteobacteria bacterium]